ncbi:type 2 lantipeptide synthetase LanM [Oceanobacillus sp. 143]|uniref:Lantibiotic biosynthesis protein dehydration domain-containing protein n=1 Tax=Oceanobacillus zhaokaii TaxID=2052660 RepID=A0A345PCE4_9BACI|nr:type 2 lanthipeptide synthetase LanM [Oceanobacillus zhaokaii]AXI07674.1 hypothetical protein CUC15_01105 [Oceanobacillus zhaokaii]QGS67854.1 type 2 lantipeptide synthetase LanM [Oceanobacillus sp. 143]
MDPITYFSNLHQALTIQERYYLIQQQKQRMLHEPSLNFWREDMSVLSDVEFANMLRLNKYRKDTFSQAVLYYVDSETKELFTRFAQASNWYKLLSKVVECQSSEAFPKKDFTYILRPFITYTSDRLKQIVFENRDLSSPNLRVPLIESYQQLILNLAKKALVHELHMKKEKNQLCGEDSAERYISFLEYYNQKEEIWGFFNKYIVLARLIITTTEYYLTHIEGLFQRIKKHMAFFKHIAGDEKQVRIERIDFNLGDTHHEGKSVAKITLTSGTKFIYKPKYSNSDHLITRLISFLNKQDSSGQLKLIQTEIDEDYLFQEYISPQFCTSETELEQFYIRSGQLLAVLYGLNATDIHMENIIAQKFNPYLIDTESILQQPAHYFSDESLQNLVQESLFLNVSSTGYLPNIMSRKQNEIDISALGGKQETYPKKIWTLIHDHTDEIQYAQTYRTIKGAHNLPNKESEAKHYLDYILQGFKEVYRILQVHRNEILEKVAAEKGLTVRMIFRHSQLYYELLNHSLHPDLLQNMLDREKILENLWSYNISYQEIIASEHQQLLFHDIPVFYNEIQTNTLIDHARNVITKGLRYDSFKLFKQKLNQLGEIDLQKQLALIRLSISQETYHTKGTGLNLSLLIRGARTNDYDYLNEAKEIGRDIISQSIQEDGKVTWIQYTNDLHHALQPMKTSFYHGLSGIILFYTTLYEMTGDHLFYAFAQTVTASIDIRDEDKRLKGISSNVYGLLYLKSYLQKDYDFIDRRLKEIGLDEMQPIKLEENEELDYINGLLGYLSMCMRFYRKYGQKKILKECQRIADYIITNMDINKIQQDGFGHGAMGYTTVFQELSMLTGEKQYSYMNKRCSARIKSANSMSWCNGQVGNLIGETLFLSRENTLETCEILDDSKLPLLNNDCLCHGNAGLMELYCILYEVTGNEKYRNQAMKIADFILDKKRKNGFYQLHDIAGYRTAGLYSGQAGIGYQLLRLTNINQVSSVLRG